MWGQCRYQEREGAWGGTYIVVPHMAVRKLHLKGAGGAFWSHKDCGGIGTFLEIWRSGGTHHHICGLCTSSDMARFQRCIHG